jgi:hypothetical protein
MNDRGRTKEAFLAAIRLLGDGSVQTHDGGHLEERVLRHMLTNSSAHFGLWILGICFVQLALAILAIGRLGLDMSVTRWKRPLFYSPDLWLGRYEATSVVEGSKFVQGGCPIDVADQE